MNGYWPLDVTQAASADLGQEFGCVCHPVLPESDRLSAATGHGPQPVVGVGQSKPSRDAGERRSRLKKQAPQGRDVG